MSKNESIMIVNKARDAAACAEANCASSFTNATNAANSAASAANSASLAGIYLGPKSTAPTTDNQGNPLQKGMLYFNTVSNLLFVWNGSQWIQDFNESTNFLATGTTTPRSLATRFADIINVKDFGALGNGIVDDTAAIQAAINSAFGKTVIIPAGTYIVTQLFGINKVSITGEGSGVSILKRKNNSSTQSILEFSGKNDFQIIDITIDGNKANQTIGANSLVVLNCYSWEVIGCVFENAKSVAGYGSGIVVIDGQNDSLIFRSKIKDCFIHNNDSDGIFINREWFIDITGCFIKNNGGGGIMVLNYAFPPVADVSNYLIIDSNTCIENTGSGISVTGYVEGGTPSNPIYGRLVPASREIIIVNNNCKKNTGSGIVYQGTNGLVSGNNCEDNSTGFVFNANLSVFSSNTGAYNKNYGIDCIGAFHSVISNNSFVTSEGVGINCGGGSFNIVSGNSVILVGSNQVSGIRLLGVESLGGTPIETIAYGTKISGNIIKLNSNSLSLGIWCARLAQAITIENNIADCPVDGYMGYICNCSNYSTKNNQIIAPQFSGQLTNTIASTSNLIIPDSIESFIVTGTNNISNIYTYSENTFRQKVLDVQITNSGTGYTPGSSIPVAFSGGSGFGAAGYAEVSNSGKVISVKITNHGSGYTSAPGVTINGSGIGATGTALVGCEPPVGREITILFTGVLTVQDAVGNLNLNGNLTTTSSNTTLTLKRSYGNWIEVSRFVG